MPFAPSHRRVIVIDDLMAVHEWLKPDIKCMSLVTSSENLQSIMEWKSPPGGWYCARSRRTLGSMQSPHFAIRLSSVHFNYLAAAAVIGVSAYPNVMSCGVGMRPTSPDEFVLWTEPRERPHQPKARGMWVGGTRRSPLLSTDPKPTTDEEVADPAGNTFLRHGETVTIGVSCDFAQNSLTFYVDDKPVRATLIPDPNGLIPSKPFEPFVWSIPVKKKLSKCCVYFAVAETGLRAEFVDWTPPPREDVSTNTGSNSSGSS